MVFSQVKQQLNQDNHRGSEGWTETVSDGYSELDVVVHPGFSVLNYEEEDTVFDWLDETRFGVNSDFSSKDSYQEYLSDLGEKLEPIENPVIFIYDENQLDQYQEFIDGKLGIQSGKENNHFIETDGDSGYINAVEIWRVAGVMEDLVDEPQITIHGEQYGRCTHESLESLELIGNNLDKDASFEYGEVFPRVRL